MRALFSLSFVLAWGPVQCGAQSMQTSFYLTSLPLGGSTGACTPTNSWNVQLVASGPVPGSATSGPISIDPIDPSGGLTVRNNGTTVGTRSALNFVPGAGI